MKSLEDAISARAAVNLSHVADDYACVAVILRKLEDDLELAVIRRAEVETDPWSGHLALPGGRKEPSDRDDIFAAAREAQEEIGIDLHQAKVLGQLDDVQAQRDGQKLRFYLRPSVFVVEERGQEKLDPGEVAELYWPKLSYLLDPQNHIGLPREYAGTTFHLPAIQFPNGKVFWGLSYLVLTDLVERLAQETLAAAVAREFPALAQLQDLSHWRKYPLRK